MDWRIRLRNGSEALNSSCTSLNFIRSAVPATCMKQLFGTLAGPSKCMHSARLSRPQMPTSDVLPSVIEVTTEASPDVMK